MSENDLSDASVPSRLSVLPEIIDPRLMIGGNQPRDFDLLKERVEDLTGAANRWATTVKEIADEETAERAEDFLRQLTGIGKKVDDAKAVEKRPHLDANTEIEGRYRVLTLTIKAIQDIINPKSNAWLKKKQAAIDEAKRQERAAAEYARQAAIVAAQKASSGRGDVIGNQVRAQELARQAAEAQKAAARPVERAQVRGAYSTRARSLRKHYSAEVKDVLLAFCYYQDRPEILEVLTKLANAEAAAAHREGREIPGCELIEREVAA